MGEEKPGTPDAEGDKSDEEATRRGLGWKSAWAPITGMVIFILITVSISLFVAPLYISQGMQAFGEEGATNPLIAVYYLVMIIVVTTIILLLRKFLKRRKRNFLKYILAAAVLFSTYAVVSPVLDVVVNGMPEEWEVQGLDRKDPTGAIAPNHLVYEDDLVYVTEDHQTSLWSRKANLTQGEFSVHDPYVVERNGSEVWVWKPNVRSSTYLTQESLYRPFNLPYTEYEITSVDLIYLNLSKDALNTLGWYENETRGVIFSLVDGNTTKYALSMGKTTYELGIDPAYGEIELNFVSRGMAYYPSSHPLHAHSEGRIFQYNITPEGNISIVEELHDIGEDILWMTYHRGILTKGGEEGPLFMIGTDQGLWIWELGSDPVKVSDITIRTQSLACFTSDEEGWEILAMRGNSLYVIDEDSNVRRYMDDYNYLMVYEDKPGGTLTIVSEEKIERGQLPEERGGYLVEGGAFAFAFGVVLLLLWKPKWWIVDLSGILMGAGVLTLIGISISILPILLLLILLAVYDFISVYKTKHMLALADSVVEAKLPILLVFPLKWGYRYEDETNLLDKSRPREAMFMGLGDVIIPGALLISAFTFLPTDGTGLLGMISPQLSVVLFSLIGMLIALFFLMYQVLKGKAHAGLPFLNGGVILGFLLGELIIYGTIII